MDSLGMALIEVANLSYRYPDGTLALDGVSFRVEDAECVGLIGPNGAGKSTLLWHLNGLLPERLRGNLKATGNSQPPAEQGRGPRPGDVAAVEVNGLAIEPAHLPAVRRAVGLLFQDPDDQLFCPTVRDDVAFGPLNLGLPREEVLARVASSLEAVGLAGYEQRLPHQLSLGERKRVCLAGVLACQPRLLALDEPSANLDPRARRRLIGILRSLGCARLVASHDLELILELCSRVIVLDQGRIHADGPTRQVLGDEPLLELHGLELPHSLR
jgi:energy-coupling factor transporter ATP-binding protein EcfA2